MKFFVLKYKYSLIFQLLLRVVEVTPNIEGKSFNVNLAGLRTGYNFIFYAKFNFKIGADLKLYREFFPFPVVSLGYNY